MQACRVVFSMIEACSLKSHLEMLLSFLMQEIGPLQIKSVLSREASRYGMVMFYTEITYGLNPEPTTQTGLGNPYNVPWALAQRSFM